MSFHRLIRCVYSTGWIYLYFFTVSAGRANFFHGNRYVKANDDATRLIFDCDGSIAGIQATVRESDFELLTKMSQSFFRRYFPVLCKRYKNYG